MAEHELNKIVDDDGEVFNLRDSTKQPTADRVTAWGSTPSDTKYPSEKLVKDALDAISTNARTIPQDISKGTNIVVNSNGTLLTNYNWTATTFIADTDLPEGVAGCFHRVGGDFFCNEFISLNTSKAFSVESWYRVKTANTSTVRLALACFDIDKNSIQATNICYGIGTLTTVAREIKNGDTEIYLTDLSAPAWDTSTYYERRLIFWDYKNSLGYTYPPETYSKHGYYKSNDNNGTWLRSSLDRENNKITLIVPWDGGTVPVGTKVSRGGSGSTYYYAANSPASGAATVWTKLSGELKGFSNNVASGGPFRPGTAFVKIGWVNTNTASPEWIEFCGIELRENPSAFNGALPVANGGTGKTSVTAGNYLVGNGTNALTEKTPNAAANNMLSALPEWSANPTDGVKLIRRDTGGGAAFGQVTFLTVWNYIKDKISSVLGLTATSYGGNAATATALSAGDDRTKLDGIDPGAEVNVQSDWNQATTTADDYIKNKPTIPSGTQLVYDCGTGSTSTTDFDNALAAFNAGNWVIIHSSGNTYHCVGTYNSGLRFKQIANETASIKVNTLNWTRGSAPSVGTQLEPSMPGHTHSQYVEKAGDTMSGNLTISKGANQGDTKFVTSRTDTGTTGWFGVGDGGQNHGVYSDTAYANTNNDVDKDTRGWVVRTDENGYSSLTGAVNGLFAKDFGATETLRGMKMFKFGYSLDREGDYTHVSATAIIEVRIYYAGVAGSSITMLFNASARGDVGSYYRLQVLSYNNWNLNSVCPVLITREESATAKYMYLGLVGGGPTSTTLRTFNYTEVKVLPLNGTQKFNWSFGWNTNDFNSNTMTMIKPYVYPRAQIGTAIGDAGTPVYVKADGDFGTASGTDVAIALKDAGRADAPVTQDWRVKVGWGGSGVDACAPNGTSTYSAGQTVATTEHLVTAYEYDGVGYYKDVQAGMVTVGNSERWNGYQLAIQNPGNTPAADTIYIF